MSRNVKSVMKSLFEDMLLYSMEYDGMFDEDFKHPRWISGNESDSRWISDTLLKEGPISYISNKKAAILEYEDTEYFVLSSISKVDKIPFFLFDFEINPGLSSIILYLLNLPLKNNLQNAQVYNLMASQHGLIPTYSGHEIADILGIYDEFYALRLDPNVRITSQRLFRFTGAVLCENPRNLSLPLEQVTVQEFSNAFSYGANNIPYDNLLNSILSTSYKHAFIELYQCIERLYQVIYVLELYDVLKPKISFTNLLKEVEQCLVWKPNEGNSIEKIFSLTPSHVYSDLIILKINKNKGKSNLANWIYTLRNNLVHLRPGQERIEFTQSEWNVLIRGILRIILYWYNTLDPKLNK